MTFDAGALINLERRKSRVRAVYARHRLAGATMHAPAPAVSEWWRGRTDAREQILGGFLVEPMDEELARVAGEAMAAIDGATIIDAIVMATAARFGGIVYTSDVQDLERLREVFPTVRVLSA